MDGTIAALQDGQAIFRYMRDLGSALDAHIGSDDESPVQHKRGRNKLAGSLVDELRQSWGGKSYMERLDAVVAAQPSAPDKTPGADVFEPRFLCSVPEGTPAAEPEPEAPQAREDGKARKERRGLPAARTTKRSAPSRPAHCAANRAADCAANAVGPAKPSSKPRPPKATNSSSGTYTAKSAACVAQADDPSPSEVLEGSGGTEAAAGGAVRVVPAKSTRPPKALKSSDDERTAAEDVARNAPAKGARPSKAQRVGSFRSAATRGQVNLATNAAAAPWEASHQPASGSKPRGHQPAAAAATASAAAADTAAAPAVVVATATGDKARPPRASARPRARLPPAPAAPATAAAAASAAAAATEDVVPPSASSAKPRVRLPAAPPAPASAAAAAGAAEAVEIKEGMRQELAQCEHEAEELEGRIRILQRDSDDTSTRLSDSRARIKQHEQELQSMAEEMRHALSSRGGALNEALGHARSCFRLLDDSAAALPEAVQ